MKMVIASRVVLRLPVAADIASVVLLDLFSILDFALSAGYPLFERDLQRR